MGQISTSASGAVGIVSSLMAIIQALGFMLGHGSGSIISRSLGSQNTDAATRFASTSFFTALVFGGIITAAGLLTLPDFMMLLGSTETILPHACAYARPILIAAPLMMSSLVMNNILRYEGKANFAMIGLVTGGVLNILLSHLGIAPQTYLTRSEWVIPIIILIATWKGAGATALIYMAGMSSVSPELYEAAAIDGAGIWQRIIHIMIPAIKKLAGTLLILQIISVFQIMYEPMVLTKGGPDNASLSLMQLMWQYAFGGSMNYGKASAVAVIVTLILLVMTAIYSYFDRKESDWD